MLYTGKWKSTVYTGLFDDPHGPCDWHGDLQKNQKHIIISNLSTHMQNTAQ